jgi:outer membrane protein
MLPQNPLIAQAMTIKDCVKYGLDNDQSIKKTALDINYTKQQEKEAYANIYPQVNGKVQYTHYLEIPTSLLPGAIFGAPEGTYIPVKFGTSDNAQTGVDVSQILYNNSVFLAVKATRAAAALGKLSVEKVREQTAYNIAQAYLNLLVLRKQSQLLTVNLDKLVKTINVLQTTVDAGFAKPIDVSRLKVAKNNLETELENIKIGDEQLQYALKFAMSMPLDTPIALADSINGVKLIDNLGKSPKSIDVDLIEMQKTLLGLQNEVVKSGYYPNAAAFGSWNVQAQRNKFDFFDTKQRWFNTALIGVQINVPIFDGFAKQAKMEQGNIRIAQANMDQQTVKRAINLQAALAQKKIASLKNTIITHQRNIALANEVLTVTQEQFKAGFAPLTDIINAESALREAQVNMVKTFADLKLAELEVVKANGTILETFN